jgi:hypothetical protein
VAGIGTYGYSGDNGPAASACLCEPGLAVDAAGDLSIADVYNYVDPTSGTAQIWYLGGAQGITIQSAADVSGANPWHIAGCGDFNGDGYPDLLWQDPVSGATQVWYLGGAQGNTFTSAADLSGPNPWRIVGVADLNQDGHPDVIWQDPTAGNSQVWYLTGPLGTTLLSVSTLSGANTWRIVGQ